MAFHGSQIDNKSPQVSRTLLSILNDISYTVVWIVCTRPLIFKPSSPFTKRLVTVPRALTTINITVPPFFQFPSKVQVFFLLLTFFHFYSVVNRDSKVHDSASYCYYYFYYSLRVFHNSFSWWSFNEVWVTDSHLKSPGLFSVFWPISIMP